MIAGVLSSKSTIAEWEGVHDCEWSLDGLPDRVQGLLYWSYRDTFSAQYSLRAPKFIRMPFLTGGQLKAW